MALYGAKVALYGAKVALYGAKVALYGRKVPLYVRHDSRHLFHAIFYWSKISCQKVSVVFAYLVGERVKRAVQSSQTTALS